MPETTPKTQGKMRLTIRDGKPGVEISDPAGNAFFLAQDSAEVIDQDGQHLASLPASNGRVNFSAAVSPEFAASLERLERDQQALANASFLRQAIYTGQLATTGIAVDLREGDLAALAHATPKPPRTPLQPAPELTEQQHPAQPEPAQATASHPRVRGMENDPIWSKLSPADREKAETALLAVLNAPLPAALYEQAQEPKPYRDGMPPQSNKDANLWRTLDTTPRHHDQVQPQPDHSQPDHGLGGIGKRPTSPETFRC